MSFPTCYGLGSPPATLRYYCLQANCFPIQFQPNSFLPLHHKIQQVILIHSDYALCHMQGVLEKDIQTRN